MFGARETWVSLGENCLSDDVLKRHGLKTFSTPFSPSRSNIDHAIAADASEFRGFLDRENLVYGMATEGRVVRSTLYECDPALFHKTASHGFETTHHDLIGSDRHRDSFARKIDRWNELRRSRIPVVFFYHHRIIANSNLPALVSKVERFLSTFSRDGAECRAIVAHQRIVEPNARGVVVSVVDERITTARFQTVRPWGGDVSSVLGRDDDDLFTSALRQIRGRRRSRIGWLNLAFNRP